LSDIASHPELNRLALKHNLDACYVVWLVLRSETASRNLSSHFTRNEVYAIALTNGLSWTRRQFNRIVEAGNGIFWGIDANHIFLRSFKRVYELLADDEAARIPSARFVKITIHKSAAKRRAELYWSWLYSKGEITISRELKAELTGCSPDQQRDYEKLLASRLIIKTNYCHIDADLYVEQLENLPTYSYSFLQERFVDNTISYVNTIAYQLPNTYIARESSSDASSFVFAPKRALSVSRTLHRHTLACDYNERCFYLFYDQWEQSMNENAYIRTYYQGKKRIWRSGHFF